MFYGLKKMTKLRKSDALLLILMNLIPKVIRENCQVLQWLLLCYGVVQ